MIETAHRFGVDGQLSGILCRPASSFSAANQPVLIFITAGLLHDVGPYRLYVDIARRYARLGFTSLRFDLGGIGNSLADTSGRRAGESAVQEVRAAMNFVNDATGKNQFILCGLCSGAETAHRTAVHDARVKGLLLLEGYIFPTPAYYLWHYLPRLLSWRKWLDFFSSRYAKWTRATAANGGDADALPGLWQGHHSPRRQVAAELNALCERRVRQLLVFSGGTGDCSYAGQFRRAFRDVETDKQVEVEFLPDADHMYVLKADRDQLLAIIDGWIGRHFTPGVRTADGRPDKAFVHPAGRVTGAFTRKWPRKPAGADEWNRPAY